MQTDPFFAGCIFRGSNHADKRNTENRSHRWPEEIRSFLRTRNAINYIDSCDDSDMLKGCRLKGYTKLEKRVHVHESTASQRINIFMMVDMRYG